MAAIQNSDAKKVAEIPKNEDAGDQPDFNQDSAILMSSDIKAEQDEEVKA